MAIYIPQTWDDDNPLYTVTEGRMQHIEAGILDVSTLIYNGLDSSKIADDAITTDKIADGDVTDAKLASPSNGIYRTLWHVAGSHLTADQTAATLALRQNAAAYASTATGTLGIPTFYLDDADYTIAGKTTKLRLRVWLSTNATAPGITFTFGLYPVTILAGTADAITFTIGTVVSGSQPTAITTPALSTTTVQTGSDFNLPADGLYAPCVVTSGTLANNAFVSMGAAVQLRHVDA